ncbi:CrcB family protein [Streptomyces sp. NPDC090994]|uniref:FluC/FEX family fluoride channel n=1 Tax=Streptomyces sp. NPDC090994 TaxID=3365969 RepID=UPI0037FB759C
MTEPESAAAPPATPPRPVRSQLPVLAAVALGGGAGAAARYAAALGWPAGAGGFPWAVFWVNVAGCAVIGVFMTVTDVWPVHRLLRPFFGTGVLGGFTTFSTFTVDFRQLAGTGHLPVALAYLAATPLAALTAVWLAASATRRVLTVTGGRSS